MATNRTTEFLGTSNSTEERGVSSVLENDHGNLTRYALPIFMALGLAGNLISFCTMLRKEWRKKSTSVYMATLAVVDTLAMFAMFNEDYLNSRGRKALPGPFGLCNWHMFLFGGSVTASSWLLVAVTTDRMVAVFMPIKSRIILTPKRATVTVTLILLAVYGLYSYVIYAIQQIPLAQRCPLRPGHINWYTTGGVFMLYSIFRGYLPAIYIVVINLAIVGQLKRRKIAKSATSGTNAIRKTTTMVVVISTAFVLLIGPSSIIITLTGYFGIRYGSEKTHNLVREITTLMGFVNHAINFYLYVGCSEKFRASLCTMIPKQSDRSVPMETSTHGSHTTEASQSTSQTTEERY